ncbi:MAG: SDR family NAD(P)-dependent oxidoreductase, partial [Phycisphaerae bacterium]|nr:SDR family NAD(P)-dependent oxidoreductase [Phycisphaerae bacterium]
MQRLKDKVILITGASRGIGKALALAFAGQGADVGVNYAKNRRKAAQVVEEIRKIGRKGQVFQADVGERAECVGLVDAFVGAFGRIDVLVNNA